MTIDHLISRVARDLEQEPPSVIPNIILPRRRSPLPRLRSSSLILPSIYNNHNNHNNFINNLRTFSEDVFSNFSDDDDTISIMNIFNNLSQQLTIINRLKSKYGQDSDLEELSSSIENIDKQYNIQIEEQQEHIKILKKDITELQEYKDNYHKTMDNLPVEIMNKKISENKCSICLEEQTTIGENYIITSCFHIFHEKCLIESMKINNKCPLCRTKLENSFYKKITIGILNKNVSSF